MGNDTVELHSSDQTFNVRNNTIQKRGSNRLLPSNFKGSGEEDPDDYNIKPRDKIEPLHNSYNLTTNGKSQQS